MDALCRAEAKVNRRRRAHGTVVRATAAQAVQAQGQKCGGLCAPLWRRHAHRVVEVGGRQGVPLECQTSRQCPKLIRLLYRNVT